MFTFKMIFVIIKIIYKESKKMLRKVIKFSEYSKYKKILFIFMFLVMTTALFSSLRENFAQEHFKYSQLISDIFLYCLGVFIVPEFFDEKRRLKKEQMEHPERFEQDKKKWDFNGKRIAFWIMLILPFPIFYKEMRECFTADTLDMLKITYNIIVYMFGIIVIPRLFESQPRKKEIDIKENIEK